MPSELSLAFTHHGIAGAIRAVCRPNDDPDALGCAPGALHLPSILATLSGDLGGYRGMLGWVQLVRSSDNASAGAAFEMDPFSLFAGADSPYCFYGHLPTLFDGPSRPRRDDMSWLAHSFLAASPLRPVARLVTPLAGFAWGFDVQSGQVRLRPPVALGRADWCAHLSVLRAAHPGWRFAEDGPPG